MSNQNGSDAADSNCQRLRHEDAVLFKPHCWLNDACITYYFEYMQKQLFQKWAGDTEHPKSLLLFEPCTAVWILFEEEISQIINAMCSMKADTKRLLIFPINDIEKPQYRLSSVCGTHWSLLVLYADSNLSCDVCCNWGCSNSSDMEHYHGSRPCIKGIYFDSCYNNACYKNACLLAEKVTQAIYLLSHAVSIPTFCEALLTTHKAKFTPPSLTVAPMEQQTNSYDCGMYVLTISELMVRLYFQALKCNSCRHSMQRWHRDILKETNALTPDLINAKRQDMLRHLGFTRRD